jgi:hypothetical protein
VGAALDKEAVMPLARVVTFDGVSSARMEEMRRDMEGDTRPDDVPATEIVVLHDPYDGLSRARRRCYLPAFDET